MSLITRATPVDLEVRGTSGRTVCGICVPFDEPTEIRDYEGTYSETIVRGAFARTIAERADKVKFLAHHDRLAMPLGRAILLREDERGLYGEFKVSETQAGDEALALIKDGALDAFSIGFRPIRETWNMTRTERTHYEVALHEVSAVNFPAYAGAEILGVRSQTVRKLSAESAKRRLRLLDL